MKGATWTLFLKPPKQTAANLGETPRHFKNTSKCRGALTTNLTSTCSVCLMCRCSADPAAGEKPAFLSSLGSDRLAELSLFSANVSLCHVQLVQEAPLPTASL